MSRIPAASTRLCWARNFAVNIDLQRNPWQSVPVPAPAPETGMIQAAERVHLSDQTVEVVVDPVEPVYPPLAQQSRVEGSVGCMRG
jgi:hypothetical protein